MQDLAQQAVNYAIAGKWKEARDTNLSILKDSPKDIDALNRLAKSYFELGKFALAKSTVNKVIKYDPYNPIAKRLVDKWKGVKSLKKKSNNTMSPRLFLEEPGKTRTVHLIHTCDRPVSANLNCGDMVLASQKSHRITITDCSGTYLGKIPDDVSAMIKKHIKIGYDYNYAIKSIDNGEIKVFIKEIVRPEKYANTPSFPVEKIDYIPYTHPGLVHNKPEITSFDEDAESSKENLSKNP